LNSYILPLFFNHYNADGVVLYGFNFSTPYQVEAMGIEKELQRQGIPTLKIETDYNQEDTEQIKTRVEAFIEMIKK